MKNYIKDKKITLIPILISLVSGIIAYLYVPQKGYDLYEYYKWTKNMQWMVPSDLIEYLFFNGEIITMLYLFLMSKIGNFQLIQVIPIITIYYILSYMIIDYGKSINAKNKFIIIVFIVLFSLFKYIHALSCFRYVLAYALVSLGAYKEYIKGETRKKYIYLYIIPIFIHTSTIIILILKQLSKIKNIKYLLTIFIFVTMLMLFPNVIISSLKLLPKNQIINHVMFKITSYLIQETIPLNIQYIFRIIQTISIIILIIYNYKTLQKSDIKLKRFFDFYLVLCIFDIVVYSKYTLFLRISDLLLFLLFVPLFNLLNKMNKLHRNLQLITESIIILFILGGIRIQIPTFIKAFFIDKM